MSASLLAAASLSSLQAATFNNNFDTDPSAAVTLDGTATWVSGGGYVSLTEQVNSQYGLLFVPDFDSGNLVGGFTATFKMQIGPGSGNAADGFSFNWGTDVPNVAGSSAFEDGVGTGLSICFDTYDNGGGEAPAIDIKVNGTFVATKKLTKADLLTSQLADVKIQYIDGLVSVDYNGNSIFVSVPAGMAAQSGANFALGARTGGENEVCHLDNLSITTTPPSGAPTITSLAGDAKGLTVTILDDPNGAVNPATVSATIDGTAVTGAATKNVDTTTYTYTNPGLYAGGSTHPVVLTFQYGSPAKTVTTPLSFTVAPYTVIPASQALAAGVIDTSKRGFLYRTHVADVTPALANSNNRTEQQLAGLLGDNAADPDAVGAADAASTAPSPSTAPIAFTVSGVINFGAGTDGRFSPDLSFPGLPGLTSVGSATESVASEVITGVEFPAAGVYHFVVNSDDGFRTSAGKNPRDPSAIILGEFEGGRGASDTAFDVYVEAPGVYPMRTTWEQGGGGYNLEWFTVAADGTRLLLNDTATDARALTTYQIPASALPAYVTALSPANGIKTLAAPSTVSALIFDAGTTLTDGSVSMTINGASVPVVATRTGGQTKVVATPSPGLAGNSSYTVVLTYTDNSGAHTVTWAFQTGPLSSVIFAIEAEDFDYSTDDVTGGLHNPQKGTAGLDVDVMPYYGGAYDGLSAVINVDYFDSDPADGGNYRTENGSGDGNDVSIYVNNNVDGGNGLGGNLSVNSSDRGTYRTTSNYSLGWSGGDWFNYTRDFPDNGKGGWWQVYIGLSYGGADPGQLSATLSRVTDGVGTTTQTLDTLGTFSGPGSGNWTRNNLVPMRNAAGNIAVVKLSGLQTVRASISSGDYDFLIFSAANPPPPSIDQAPVDSVKRDAAIFDWVLKDGGSQVNPATVTVTLNNVDVTSKATVTKTATGATVHLDLSSSLQASGQFPWAITFKDNSPTPQTVSGSGTVVINPYPTPGVFVIEAEDFNYSEDGVTGGKTNPQKGTADLDVDVMPYLGGAYDTLNAVEFVDYFNNDGNDSDVYRTELGADGQNEVNIGGNNGNRYSNDRGVYTVTSNYKIGWTDSADWCNYTRTFPAGDYNVWAALSYDGRGASQLTGSLALVTSDPSTSPQTTQALGTFDAPGSAGWGRNELVPMKTAGGTMASVHMAGVQTVRFNMKSGDFDYLVFVPTNPINPPPQITKVTLNANGSITIEWSGGGTLQAATSLAPGAAWTDVTGATSPYTFTPQAGVPALFGRIKQ